MNVYETDINELTCSCPNWTGARKEFPIDDPRRLCKHIVNKLDINNLPNKIKQYRISIDFYQEKERGYRLFDELIKIPESSFIAEYIDGDWISIFDIDSNRYGLLILDDGFVWAKSTKPNNHKIVETFFSSKEYQYVMPLTKEEIKKFENALENKFTIESGNFVVTTQERPYEIIAKDIDAETYYDQMHVTNEAAFIDVQGKKYFFDRDSELIEIQINDMIQKKLSNIHKAQ